MRRAMVLPEFLGPDPDGDANASAGTARDTPDDATRKGFARFLGRELVFDQRIAAKIRERFAARGIEMPESNLRQAFLPEGAIPLQNPEGTAPGIFLVHNDRYLILLPGPPHEMKATYSCAEAILRKELDISQPIYDVFRTVGVPESAIEEWISEIEMPQGIEIAYYPSLRGVDVFLRGKTRNILNRAAGKVSKIIGIYTFCRGDEQKRLEQVIGEILKSRNETLSVAESCTGGMLASWMVDIPGCSDYFKGGVVSYSNESKVSILGVREKDIVDFGAVSPEVARQMAIGVRHRFNSTYGIGITGIAGPGGETPTKPVGLVYIALSTPSETFVRRYHFVGGRDAIRARSATAALDLLWIFLAHGGLKDYHFEDGGEWE